MPATAATAAVLALLFIAANGQRLRDPFYDLPRGAEDDVEAARPRPQPVVECAEKEMDLWFVLDSSSSIYVHDYDRQLAFARNVTARLDVRPGATRVGLLTFSDSFTRPVVELGQYRDADSLLDNINVRTLPYRTGITNTHLALEFVRQVEDFRQDVVRAIVVVTDGVSRAPGETARQARMAREAGFYLFVVGIGQYLEESEWRAIASDPDDRFIFNITNHGFLPQVTAGLPPRACSLEPIVPGGSCRVDQDADLIFAATPGAAADAITLIDHLTEVTAQRRGRLSVSYALSVCDGGEQVEFGNLDRYCDRELDASLQPVDDTTNPMLFQRLNRLSCNAAEANPGSRTQVIVLFVNDAMLSRDATYASLDASRQLRQNGVEIIMVDLGMQSRQKDWLPFMARNEDDVVRFNEGSLAGQMQAKADLVDKICDALSRPARAVTCALTTPPPTTTRRTRRPPSK